MYLMFISKIQFNIFSKHLTVISLSTCLNIRISFKRMIKGHLKKITAYMVLKRQQQSIGSSCLLNSFKNKEKEKEKD